MMPARVAAVLWSRREACERVGIVFARFLTVAGGPPAQLATQPGITTLRVGRAVAGDEAPAAGRHERGHLLAVL